MPQRPGGLAGHVREAGSWPRLHSTAGSETQLPDSLSWVLPLVRSFPLSPRIPRGTGAEAGRLSGGRALICHSSIFLLPQARRQVSQALLSPNFHCPPPPVLALRMGSPAARRTVSLVASPIPSLRLSAHPASLPLWLAVCVSLSPKTVRYGRAAEIIRSHAFILQMRKAAQRGEGPAAGAQQTMARPMSRKHTALHGRRLQ